MEKPEAGACFPLQPWSVLFVLSDVGEGGGRLAGGQKQCIAVIRALVRDPQVIILDEATSKLDVEAQHSVRI